MPCLDLSNRGGDRIRHFDPGGLRQSFASKGVRWRHGLAAQFHARKILQIFPLPVMAQASLLSCPACSMQAPALAMPDHAQASRSNVAHAPSTSRAMPPIPGRGRLERTSARC